MIFFFDPQKLILIEKFIFNSKEDLLSYEANDPFIQNFIRTLDLLLAQFKDSLSTNNYETLVGVITLEIVNLFEKVISKCSFNKVNLQKLV